MPPLETHDRRQKAVLWAANGADDYGDVKVDAPVEIKVRWKDGRQEGLDAAGSTIALDATVVTARDIPVNSIMWLGELEDVADPPINLKQVVTDNMTPDIKGRNIRRTVGLMRYSNELPVLA